MQNVLSILQYCTDIVLKHAICNAYTTGKCTSALPAQARGVQARGRIRMFRQNTSTCGIMNHNSSS